LAKDLVGETIDDPINLSGGIAFAKNFIGGSIFNFVYELAICGGIPRTGRDLGEDREWKSVRAGECKED
jgi:hypothetical protein